MAVKPVYFGRRDGDLLDYLQQIDNFSEWVKERIRRERQEEKLDPRIRGVIETLIEAKLAGCNVTSQPERVIADMSDGVKKEIEAFF